MHGGSSLCLLGSAGGSGRAEYRDSGEGRHCSCGSGSGNGKNGSGSADCQSGQGVFVSYGNQ